MINLIHMEIDLCGIIPNEIFRFCSIMLIIIYWLLSYLKYL